MEEKYMKSKKILIIAMCSLICIMAVGYAAFATKLTITGTSSIESTWKVVFTDITEVSKTSGIKIKETPTASGTTATFNVDLTSPGDKIVYKITVANQGTLNAVINNITTSQTGSDAIKFEVTGIAKGDKLAKGASTTFDVAISYDNNVTSQPSDVTGKLVIDINYVQDINGTTTGEETYEKLSAKILSDNQAQADTNIDFSQISSDTNGKGLYYTSTNTEDNKVTYYFRGAVENNYVSFRSFKDTCTYNGKIVSTVYADGTGKIQYKRVESENECLSSNVCTMNALGYTYQIVNSAISSETCAAQGGTWTGEQATWGNYNETWRIIRINEDGNIRIIRGIFDLYDNITASFNENDSDTTYVGYMYGTAGSTAYTATHKNTNSSIVKTRLDNWYKENLTSYSSIIADSGFCGDRSLSSGLGYGTNATNYGAYNRLVNNKMPQFKCPQSNDLYTTKSSTKGNKALTYPIGLITADEVAYAGGVYGIDNQHFYLTKNSELGFWTMTPLSYDNGAHNFYFKQDGDNNDGLTKHGVNELDDIGLLAIPVINLKSDIQITNGDGTANNPYVIKTN